MPALLLPFLPWESSANAHLKHWPRCQKNLNFWVKPWSKVVWLLYIAGHFVSPFVAHAFCNHMGFPDLAEVFGYKQPRAALLLLAFLLGLVSWASLVGPLTEPSLYGNDLYAL